MSIEAFQSVPAYVWLVAIAIGILTGVVTILLVWAFMKRRQEPKGAAEQDLRIDLNQLGAGHPPDTGPQLEFFGTPVQLVVLVLAPTGRAGLMPPSDQLRDAVNELLPGLAEMLDVHRPIFRRWPEQLSSHGFVHSFFSNIQLPGNRGKGTPWCGVAGKFDFGDGHLLAGLICRASAPNTLSQVTIEHTGKWHDVLRVRNRAS